MGQNKFRFTGGKSAVYATGVAIPDFDVKSKVLFYFMDGMLDGPK